MPDDREIVRFCRIGDNGARTGICINDTVACTSLWVGDQERFNTCIYNLLHGPNVDIPRDNDMLCMLVIRAQAGPDVARERAGNESSVVIKEGRGCIARLEK